MKTLLLILLTVFYLSGCGVGVSEATNAQAFSDDAEGWRTVKIAVADLTLSLPPRLSGVNLYVPTEESNSPGTDYNYTYFQPDNFDYEAEIVVTEWKKGFKAMVPSLENPTPEQLVFLNVTGDRMHIEAGSAPVEASHHLTLDGVPGGFVRVRNTDDKNKIWVNWYTYRYHKGKAQKISICVVGERSDLGEMMKIIESAKFERR